MVNTPHKLILLPNRTYQAMVRSDIKKIAIEAGLKKKDWTRWISLLLN